MHNPNKHQGIDDDHVMTSAEMEVVPLENEAQQLTDLIEIRKLLRRDSSEIESQLREVETKRLVALWLNNFTDDDEKAEAIDLAIREGLPPEVFTTPENIHQGPITLQ